MCHAQAGTQHDYGPAGHTSEASIAEALGSSPTNEYLYTALISEALAVILELRVYCPAGRTLGESPTRADAINGKRNAQPSDPTRLDGGNPTASTRWHNY